MLAIVERDTDSWSSTEPVPASADSLLLRVAQGDQQAFSELYDELGWAGGVADTIEPLYRRVFQTGQPVRNMEVRGTTPARPGVPRDWLVDYYPIQEPDGSVQAVAAMPNPKRR